MTIWENLVDVVKQFIVALAGYLGGSAATENAAQKQALETAATANKVRSDLAALSGDAARDRLHEFDRQ
jgi:hypothetical protein